MAQEARRALTRALAALVFALAAGVAVAAEPAKKGPVWAELTAEQQQILAPLKPSWETLSRERRAKWLGIAKHYPKMQPNERERVDRRMEAWAKLTPEQRRAAREQYLSIGKLPPEKRQDLTQQWAEYQSLMPTEKRKFDASPAPEVRAKRKPRSPAKPQTRESRPAPSMP